MKLQFSVIVLFLFVGTACVAEGVEQGVSQMRVMPLPSTVHMTQGRLKVDASFTVVLQGPQDARVSHAAGRLVRRVGVRTLLQISPAITKEPAQATLVVQWNHSAKTNPQLGEDESYSLETTSRQALLRADSSTGILRGLETLFQMIDHDADGYFVPAATIEDHPRFPWRGLMIDVSRHYEPMEVLKRNLEAMAAVKLNVFHWHLSDDQGFRVESREFPRLHEMGSDGYYYTHAEIQELVAYAAERGIRVVPEFDIPGHTSSWLTGYPELGSAAGPHQIEHGYGIFDQVLDPTRESTYKFLDKFVGEMAKLFPDAYVHIGGDENNGKQWNSNPNIRAFMKAHDISNSEALQAYFNRRVQKILEKHGKKMVGWDEVLNPELPQTVVVQSWRGEKSLADGARRGYQGILSAPYYLDHMKTAAEHYASDPLPSDNGLSANQASLVLGGEVCMWSEFISPESIDSRIWPRTAVVAERFWSPASVVDSEDMYRRLDAVSATLEEMGLKHEFNPERMLRRNFAMISPQAARAIADAVQPGPNSDRWRSNDSQLLPLDHMTDWARPECRLGRELPRLVNGYLHDAEQREFYSTQLREVFTAWNEAHAAIQALPDSSPLKAELGARVQDLSELGTAGLEAVTYLSSGSTPAAGWAEQKSALITRSAPQKALLRFPWLPSLQSLIFAAAHPLGSKAFEWLAVEALQDASPSAGLAASHFWF